MDNSKLTISLLLVAFLLIIVTLVTLRKNKINVKFAIIWFIPAIAIALLALLPNLFIKFTQLFGFQTISNLIIGFILVLILFYLKYYVFFIFLFCVFNRFLSDFFDGNL